VYLVVSALVRDHYINAAVVADAGSVCNTCITPRVLGLLLSCCVDSASLSLSRSLCVEICVGSWCLLIKVLQVSLLGRCLSLVLD
jgi:hypothetical protein